MPESNVHNYNIVTTDGVTVAIVAFLFACMAFPSIIKHRQQYYAAFFVSVVIVLLSTMRLMLYKSAGAYVLLSVLTGVAQVVAMVMLFMAAGGLTLGQFANELRGSYEVIRRGGEQKEVIVPLRGEQPRVRDEYDDDDLADDSPVPPPARPPETPRRESRGPVPLD